MAQTPPRPGSRVLDIYRPPEGKKLLDRKAMLDIVVKRSLAISKLREVLKQARISRRAFEQSLLPKGTFNASIRYANSSDLTKAEALPIDPATGARPDDDLVAMSKSRAVGAGVGIAGALPYGVSYGFSSMPRVSRSDTFRPTGQTEPKYDVAYNANLNVELWKGSWLLDGKNEFSLQDANLKASLLDAQRGFGQALVDGQAAFFDLVKQDLSMAIARAGQDAAAKLLEDTRARQKVGEIDRLAVVQAELQDAQSRLALRKQEADHARSLESIREKVGLTPEEFATIYPDVSIFRTPPARAKLDIAALLKTARELRPDLRKARIDESRAEIALQRARSATKPQLSAGYEHGWARSDKDAGVALKEATDYRQRTQSYGLTLTQTLWGGAERDGVRTAESSAAASRLATTDLLRVVEREVRSIAQDLDFAFDRLEIARVATGLAEQRAEAELLKFQVGEVGIKNVVDGERDLTNARKDELEAKMTIADLELKLELAIGKLPEGIDYGF